jgi:hypothetical protein
MHKGQEQGQKKDTDKGIKQDTTTPAMKHDFLGSTKRLHELDVGCGVCRRVIFLPLETVFNVTFEPVVLQAFLDRMPRLDSRGYLHLI